jgi:phage terminase small subunit
MELNISQLTPKQERFAAYFVELSSATAAYRAAYDTSEMSEKSIHEAASRLKSDSKVTARIHELRENLATHLGVSRASIVAELEEARKIAVRSDNPGAIVRVVMAKAKILGFIDNIPEPLSQRERTQGADWVIYPDPTQ